MEHIFFEKQEGSLCAQHCLNALLQGAYFTAVDLGTLAQSLDDEERSRMAESGLESEEYRRFLAQPSGNMDDSGYFSVQVISRALQVWGLDLLPYSSTDQEALIAQQCPEAMTAFICNYRDHWFTIRKLGSQWFNLNSLLSRPQLISDTYLAMFLAQLQQEGYSIFVVRGTLPDCPADLALTVSPYVPPTRREPVATATSRDLARSVSGSDDEDLRAALALSLAEQDGTPAGAGVPLSRGVSSEDEELQAALALSLGVKEGEARGSGEQEESELDKALRLSMECCDTRDARPADPDEVRRKRLAFLDSTKS